jgi:hypothetical protein
MGVTLPEYASRKDAEKKLTAARKRLKKTADALREASKKVSTLRKDMRNTTDPATRASMQKTLDSLIKDEDTLTKAKSEATKDCVDIQFVLDRMF